MTPPYCIERTDKQHLEWINWSMRNDLSSYHLRHKYCIFISLSFIQYCMRITGTVAMMHTVHYLPVSSVVECHCEHAHCVPAAPLVGNIRKEEVSGNTH